MGEGIELPSIQTMRNAFLALDELGLPNTSCQPLFASRSWSITTEGKAYRRFVRGLCNTEEVAVPRWYWQRLPLELRALFLNLTLGCDSALAQRALPEGLLTKDGRPRWCVVSRFGRYILHSRPEVQGDERVYFGDDTLFLMKKARQHLPRRPAQVLDLCCGSGGVGLGLPSFDGHLVGVDINPYAVELARLASQSQGLPHYSYSCGKAESVLDERYDLIVGNPPTLPPELGGTNTLYATGTCSGLLHLLERLACALTPEGHAILTVFSIAEADHAQALDSLRKELPSVLAHQRGYRYTVRRQFPLSGARWLRHVTLEILPQSAPKIESFHPCLRRFQLPLLDWRRTVKASWL